MHSLWTQTIVWSEVREDKGVGIWGTSVILSTINKKRKKRERHFIFLEFNIVKISVLSKLIYKFNAI